MEFCLCGNSTCICETSCTCLRQGCLCFKCHRLRKEEWDLPFESIAPSEFELFSPSKELAQSFSDVGISECEFSSRLPAAAQEIHLPSSSFEVANKVTIDSESSIHNIESRAKDLQQVSSDKKLIPTEEEMVSVQDTGTNKTFQPKPCSSKYFSRKYSVCKALQRRKKQVHKTITHAKGKSPLSKNNSESSSDEIYDRYFDDEGSNLYCSRFLQQARNYELNYENYESAKNYESDSKKSSSDTSSTSSGSSSGVSIIDFPDDEWDPDAVPYLPDNHLIGISSVRFAPRHIDISHPQRQESTTPTMMFGEENERDVSSERSISPIEVFTRNPTAIVSYSGELYILPLRKRHPQSSPPRTPPSPSIHVSQSPNTSKKLSDSTVKVSAEAADISPTNMQNSEKLQTERGEKTSSTLESCTSNVQENEQEKDNSCLTKRENLSEKNSKNVSDKKI